MLHPFRWCAAIAGLAAAAASPALAHHSAAMFDRTMPYTAQGTVKSLLWANPHVWVTVLIPNGKGGDDTYQYEGPSPGGMQRNGFGKAAFDPGTKLKFLIAPYRDKSNRGEFMAVWTSTGQQIKF